MPRGHKALLGMLAVGFLFAGLSPAPAGPLDGFPSANVEFVKNVPYGGFYGLAPVGDSVEGVELRGKYLYAGGTELSIFDVSDPENPELLSELPFLGANGSLAEDPDTNGKILPTSTSFSGTPGGGSGQDLIVIDVTDKTKPFVLARVPELGGHTVTCVQRCRWAYISDGKIIDLRAPAAPKLAETNWCDAVRPQLHNPQDAASVCSHDVTEVAPGLVLTASIPMFLFDVRDPARPKVIARSDGSPYSYGGVTWPRGGRDRFLLSFQEAPGGIFMPNCAARDTQRNSTFDSAFKTWDTRDWRKNGLFVGLDEYAAADGTWMDGNPPASMGGPYAGCGSLWFDVHPQFHNGGLVVEAVDSNGIKFLDIDEKGDVAEVGFWLPTVAEVEGSITARWITDEIVYAFSIGPHGIDILRFRGGAK